MKITKIGYSKTYQIGLANFEKLWLEADVTEGDDIRQCQYALKKQVESFHFESNKAAEKQAIQEQIVKEVNIGITPKDILSCETLKVLQDTYKYLVKNKPKLQEAYDQRFAELSKTS